MFTRKSIIRTVQLYFPPETSGKKATGLGFPFIWQEEQRQRPNSTCRFCIIITNVKETYLNKNTSFYIISFLILPLNFCCSPLNHWQIYNTSNTPLTSDRIRQIIIENNELSWVGTYGSGLYKVNEGKWQKVDSPFAGNHILCLRPDNKGGLWIGTANNGAYYYFQDNWVHIDQDQGLSDNNVWDILISKNKEVWLCSRYRGACRKSSDSLRCFNTKDGLPDNQVTVATEDSRGTIWLGTARGGLCGYKDEQFEYINSRNGISGNYIRAIICDSIPRWVGSWDGGLDYFNGEKWEHIEKIKKPVVFLGFDKNNKLWVGTWGYGIYIQRTKEWENLTVENSGLPDNHVIDIDFAEDGKIYFATSQGVAVYSP